MFTDVKFVVLSLLLLSFCWPSKCDDVQGCGGYVKSEVEINYAQVGIKLYTAQGSLKDETECAPNDGYYFMPVYDKGQYRIKVVPPPGWSVEPSEVAVTFDGSTDPCSLKEDINFHFKGFAVIGRVLSAGGTSDAGGPAGVMVSLHRQSNLVLTTETAADGRFVFTPLAGGDYTVTVAHPTWSFIGETTSVSVRDQNGEVVPGSLLVRGYRVQGTVMGDASEGVHIVLHPVDHITKQHYKKYPPGCTIGAPDGYSPSSSDSVGEALCHTATDTRGKYTFTQLVPGQYRLVAYRHTPLTRYVMAPDVLSLTVQHDDVAIKENFKVEGFSATGRVVRGGAGVAGAVVQLSNSEQTVTTDKHGAYTLENVRHGKHTVTVTADGLQFPATVITLTATRPSLAEISPSHYSACFSVQLDKTRQQQQRQQWTVRVSGTKVDQQLLTTDTAGHGCTLLVPGDYRATVQLTTDQKERGIRFGPVDHSFSVGSLPLEELLFSQFLGQVQVSVRCLQACPLLDLTMITAGGLTHTATATGAVGSKLVSTTFKEVVPGKYQVSAVRSGWCWRQDTVSADVNSKNIKVSLAQSGYQLTVTSSHSATLDYTVKGGGKITGTVEVSKGTTKTCLTSSGLHVFTPRSCHQFLEQSYSWDTTDPSLVSLTATHHTVSAIVRSSQAGAFKIHIKHEDGSSSVADPTDKSQSETEYVFEFLAKEHEEVVLTPSSDDNLFQYEPTSHSQTIGTDCMASGVTFRAVKALFIHGKVIPGVAGVEITIKAVGSGDGDEVHLFTTSKDGSYTAGPLDNSLEYSISASKQGYTLKPIDKKTGHFEAFKLAEVIVEIVDKEDEKTLPGVVVSMSGGKSYRQNSMTGEGGVISFHSLLPGEYFLRFAMKEYNFEPPTKMVTVQQGATINIKVKGVRVAYSAVGSTTSLTGVMESEVAVEAVGLGTECAQYQEDAVTDATGAFRIKGLLPRCEYIIGLKNGDDINRHIERMMPVSTKVKVTNKDVTGLDLTVLRHFNQMDVVGFVDSPKEHINSLSIKVYRDDVADSPIHTIKIANHPFFMLPPMMADGKTYTIQLESSLSTMQYSYRTPEVSFVADSSFKQLKLNFRPSHRNLDGDVNQNTMAGIFMAIAIIGMVANFEKIAPAIDWLIDFISTAITKRGKSIRSIS